MYWGDVAEAIGADDRIGDCDTMTDEAQKAEELLESRFYEVHHYTESKTKRKERIYERVEGV